MKYYDASGIDRWTDEFESWHILYLNKVEREQVFMSYNDTFKGWRRNGGTWHRSNGASDILKREINDWVRNLAGHRSCEVWSVDRYFYEDETLPDLSPPGRLWRQHFECYAPRSHGWEASTTVHDRGEITRGARAWIAFTDPKIATLFRLFWL